MSRGSLSPSWTIRYSVHGAIVEPLEVATWVKLREADRAREREEEQRRRV